MGNCSELFPDTYRIELLFVCEGDENDSIARLGSYELKKKIVSIWRKMVYLKLIHGITKIVRV